MAIADLQYLFCHWLSCHLPIKQAYWIARLIGRCNYLIKSNERRSVKKNIAIILSKDVTDSELNKMAKELYSQFARTCVHNLYYSQMKSEQLLGATEVEGLKHLNDSLSLGRGAILISGHIGLWELGAMVLSSRGYKIGVVAHSHPNPKIEKIFRKRREDMGVKTVYDTESPRIMLSMLKEKYILGVLCDRSYSRSDRRSSFFGITAKMPYGASFLHYRSGSPILPAVMLEDDVKIGAFRLSINQQILSGSNLLSRKYNEGFYQSVIVKSIEKLISDNFNNWYMFEELGEYK